MGMHCLFSCSLVATASQVHGVRTAMLCWHAPSTLRAIPNYHIFKVLLERPDVVR